jgi:hypothetical protein
MGFLDMVKGIEKYPVLIVHVVKTLCSKDRRISRGFGETGFKTTKLRLDGAGPTRGSIVRHANAGGWGTTFTISKLHMR